MKELIEQLRKYDSRIDRELADALEQQAKQIEERDVRIFGLEAAISQLNKRIEELKAEVELDEQLVSKALALQPHASIVAKIKADAVREWASYEENGGSMNAYEYADLIEREVK